MVLDVFECMLCCMYGYVDVGGVVVCNFGKGLVVGWIEYFDVYF